MSCGDIVRDLGWVGGSGLIAGRGLSSLRIYELDDRGVLEDSLKICLMMGDSRDETPLLLGIARGVGSRGDLDGLSTGTVFDRRRGLGPREKFCVPRTWAAFEGWEVGNNVKLDRAGEVARRMGTGGGLAVAAKNG